MRGPEEPVDMRGVIARIVDDSDFLEFKAQFGAPDSVRARGSVRHAGGHRHQQRSARSDGANKATHFIQHLLPDRVPLVYLQNTTRLHLGRSPSAWA